MINDNQVEGATFFSTKFDGISNTIYGTKKMHRARL
jgi:hypothetical protein